MCFAAVHANDDSMADVILVDDNDQQTGVMEKLEAHRKGALHRAFSIFIINDEGKMLLQKRAAGKYHSAGLWTNACCSHPMPGESVASAARRRLQEELGFDCDVSFVDSLKYFVRFEDGLTEHEFDHLLLGYYNGPISPNPDEVGECRYYSLPEIDQLLLDDELQFTFWFRLAYPLMKLHLASPGPVYNSIH